MDIVWPKKIIRFKIRNVSSNYPQSVHRFTTNIDWVCVCSISENFLDLTNFVQNICVTNCKDFKNVLEFDLFLFLEIYSLCQILQKWFFAKMLFIFFFNICLLMSFPILLCKQVWWKKKSNSFKKGACCFLNIEKHWTKFDKQICVYLEVPLHKVYKW